MEPWDLGGLAPVWRRTLERKGLSGPESARAAEVWLAAQAEPTAESVAMLVRRVRGEASLADLAREHGVPHSRVQAWLGSSVLRLLVPHLGEVAAWTRARETGHTDEAIAELSGVLPELVTVALDGWPARRPPVTGTRAAAALDLWRAGGPRREVAAALGLPAERFAADLGAGRHVLTPRRLYQPDLGRRFGWSESSLKRYRRGGRVPEPDGRDGRPWWWETTIDDWQEGTPLWWCTACGIAFVTRRGLAKHTTGVHSQH